MALSSRVSLLILYTNAESGAYSRDSSRCPRRRRYIFASTTHLGSVPSLSGHTIAYRWRSLPRVRWHRAGSPQGSSSNGCCLCTMHQMLLCSSLFPHPLLVYSEYIQISGGVCQNISTAVMLYCFVEPFFPPTYGLYTCNELSVGGTISSCCISKHSYYCCTVDPFSPSRLLSVHV